MAMIDYQSAYITAIRDTNIGWEIDINANDDVWSLTIEIREDNFMNWYEDAKPYIIEVMVDGEPTTHVFSKQGYLVENIRECLLDYIQSATPFKHLKVDKNLNERENEAYRRLTIGLENRINDRKK